MDENTIEKIVNENLFTPETYPGCTDEEYAELNAKLLTEVIAANPDEYNIYEIIKRVQETLQF